MHAWWMYVITHNCIGEVDLQLNQEYIRRHTHITHSILAESAYAFTVSSVLHTDLGFW